MRLLWATAELQRGRQETALEILRDQVPNGSTEKGYRDLLAAIYLGQTDDYLEAKEPNVRLGYLHLIKGLKTAPDNVMVQQRVVSFAQEYQIARKAIYKACREQFPSRDKRTVSQSQTLGNLATMFEDYARAARHFENALAKKPADVVLKNNLAWSLGNESPELLKRALELSKTCVQIGSSEPSIMAEMRITRGSLLLKNELWDEAINHLKAAEKVFPDRDLIHQGLATAYAAQGQQDLADQHRNHAPSRK